MVVAKRAVAERKDIFVAVETFMTRSWGSSSGRDVASTLSGNKYLSLLSRLVLQKPKEVQEY